MSGTLVLLTAFRRLLERSNTQFDDTTDIVTDPVGTDSVVTGAGGGADLFCAAVAREVAADPVASALLALLPWLPPDWIEESSLGVALGDVAARVDPTAAVRSLVDLGLLNRPAPGAVSIHRLPGAALRRRLPTEVATDVVLRFLKQPATRELLLRSGGSDSLQVLGAAIAGDLDGRPGAGQALTTLAAAQEIYQPALSLATYTRAEGLVGEDTSADRASLADSLHARARSVNQDSKSTLQQIASARVGLVRAIALRATDEKVDRAKHLALDALLRQRAARSLEAGTAERAAELRAVAAILEESYRIRLDALGRNHPVVDRAYFNRAGVRLVLAQEFPQEAATMLDEAEEVYVSTESFRRDYYGQNDTPLLSASMHGRGIVQYLRLVLGKAADPAATAVEGLRLAAAALTSRQNIEAFAGTPGAKADVVKSALLLAKTAVATAQVYKAPTDKEQWQRLKRELDNELGWHLEP